MKKPAFLYASLIPIIVFLFFLPSLFNGFVNWDDPYLLWKNPLIKDFSWRGIQTIFVAMWTGQYHRFIPLSMVLFTLEYHFFGINPFGYHLVSVLLHSINSLGVYVLVYLLTARMGPAIVAALLFGLHPLAVQPVAWAAAGQYPIGAFFFLSTIISYLCAVRVPSQRTRFRILSFITFFLALLCYGQMSITLPFILLAIDYYLQGKISQSDVLHKSAFFLLTFYFGWLVLKAAHHTAADYVPFFVTHHLSLFHRLNLSSEALWMYGQKFFIPHPLSCWYPTVYYLHGELFLYSLTAAGVLFFFAAFRKHANLRISFLGILWFLINTAPFLHIYGFNESIINDRYLYIPSIGILLMLIGIWENVQARSTFSTSMMLCLKGLGALWFIFIIFVSYQQIGVWRDSGRLWTNFILQYPGFPDGYLSRSDYYLTIKEPQLALRDTDSLLKLDPQNAAAYQNKGHAFFQLHQWRAEAEAYTKVIELNPNFVQIYVDRGAAFFMLGEDNLALADFNRALHKDPKEVNALLNRGIVEEYKKEHHEAK